MQFTCIFFWSERFCKIFISLNDVLIDQSIFQSCPKVKKNQLVLLDRHHNSKRKVDT